MVYALFWTKDFYKNWHISILLETTTLVLVKRDVHALSVYNMQKYSIIEILLQVKWVEVTHGSWIPSIIFQHEIKHYRIAASARREMGIAGIYIGVFLSYKKVTA